MVKIVAWNIETFGSRYGAADGGGCESMRVGMIAATVLDCGADILIIQELMRGGVGWLETLCTYLNEGDAAGEWRFDWVKAASSLHPTTAWLHTSFQLRAHLEAYGVVFKASTVRLYEADQRLSGGVNNSRVTAQVLGDHAITLVTMGYPLTFPTTGGIPISFRTDVEAWEHLGFPVPHCLPTNKTYGGLRTRTGDGQVVQSNTTIPKMTESRRPCVIKLAMPGDQTHYVVVYHAPRQGFSPQYGSLIGFAARELDGERVSYMGDFNIPFSGQYGPVRDKADELGYRCKTFGDDGRAFDSYVEPRDDVHDTWRNGNDVLTRPFDFAFSSNDGHSADIVNVIEYMATVDSNCRKILNEILQNAIYSNHLFEGGGRIYRQTGFGMVIDDARSIIKSWRDGTDYTVAGAGDGTAMGILYNILLSDHLPVSVTIP